jgi:hypothetical protein
MKAHKLVLGHGVSRLVFLAALAVSLVSCGGGDTYDKVVHTRLGLAGKTVLSLAIDPTVPSILYAGTDLFGVYKSVDGGANWIQLTSGLGDTYVTALVVDPNVHTTLYAGTWSGGVYRSIDGASNWAAINSGLTDNQVTSLAIDPSSPATLYAGTVAGGVCKTVTSGASWSPSSTGLPAEMYVLALAVNPSSTA